MLLCLLIVIGTVVLDQLSKLWVLHSLAPIGSYPLWQDVFHFTYVENTGAAFGMLQDHRWVFMVISSVAILAMILYVVITKPKNRLEITAVAFIIGGGIGNIIDRFAFGYVRDMIEFTFMDFAIFNVADAFACIGAVMLVIYLLFFWSKNQKKQKEMLSEDGK